MFDWGTYDFFAVALFCGGKLHYLLTSLSFNFIHSIVQFLSGDQMGVKFRVHYCIDSIAALTWRQLKKRFPSRYNSKTASSQAHRIRDSKWSKMKWNWRDFDVLEILVLFFNSWWKLYVWWSSKINEFHWLNLVVLILCSSYWEWLENSVCCSYVHYGSFN